MEFLPLQYDNQKVYAGFWRRSGALVIDSLIYLPIYLLYYLPSLTLQQMLNIIVLNFFFYSFYSAFFHYKYGATIGKLVTRIRVTRPDGSKLGIKHALLRTSIELSLGTISTILFLYAISKVDVAYYYSLASNHRFWYITTFLPVWYQIIEWSGYIWIFSELIVLFFNKRKRALHDFIASTIVIKKKFAYNQKAL